MDKWLASFFFLLVSAQKSTPATTVGFSRSASMMSSGSSLASVAAITARASSITTSTTSAASHHPRNATVRPPAKAIKFLEGNLYKGGHHPDVVTHVVGHAATHPSTATPGFGANMQRLASTRSGGHSAASGGRGAPESTAAYHRTSPLPAAARMSPAELAAAAHALQPLDADDIAERAGVLAGLGATYKALKITMVSGVETLGTGVFNTARRWGKGVKVALDVDSSASTATMSADSSTPKDSDGGDAAKKGPSPADA